MSLVLTQTGPSVRSDAKLADASDTTVYSIVPKASMPVSAGADAALGEALIRGAPWSEAGHAGRLLRGALAERLSVPCYDRSTTLEDSAQRGHVPPARGETTRAATVGPLSTEPTATIDITTDANLVRSPGSSPHTLFVNARLLFEPAYRAVDADAQGGIAAVSNFQDVIGVAAAPTAMSAPMLRLRPESLAPGREDSSLRYAMEQTMCSAGDVRVVPSSPALLTPCTEGKCIFDNHVSSSAGGDEFGLSTRLTDVSAVARTSASAQGRSGAAWLAGLSIVGGRGAPRPYQPGQPGSLVRRGPRAPRLHRLPTEATAGVEMGLGLAYEVDLPDSAKDLKIDLLALQRMVSIALRPDGGFIVTATLFLAACRIVLRCGRRTTTPRLAISHRRCWGTDLRNAHDALGTAALARPVLGEAWHG